MSKPEKQKLLSPPRYPRNDPRNKLRTKAGQVIGQKLQGLDLPVRKLRKKDSSYSVTIPAWLVRELGFEEGDDIVFGITDVPGVVVLSALKRPDEPADNEPRQPGMPF